MRRHTIIFFVIALIVISWMIGCSSPTETAVPTYQGSTHDDEEDNLVTQSGVRVGNEAPDFTLTDSYGDNVALADLHGKPVLLFFWFQACHYCEQEYAHIQSIQDNYGGDMTVLGVNLGDSAETINAVRSEHGLTFRCLVATSEMQAAYDISTVPHALIIDSQGVVTYNNHSAYITDTEIQESVPRQ